MCFCQLEIDHVTQQPKETCQMTCRVGWAGKEWSSTNHKYNKHRPSSRLTKGIAKYFLVFEMSLGSNSEVLILMKLKIRISRHY